MFFLEEKNLKSLLVSKKFMELNFPHGFLGGREESPKFKIKITMNA